LSGSRGGWVLVKLALLCTVLTLMVAAAVVRAVPRQGLRTRSQPRAQLPTDLSALAQRIAEARLR
jgi:hypothetical protein